MMISEPPTHRKTICLFSWKTVAEWNKINMVD